MEDGHIRGAEDQQPTYRGGDRSYAYIDGEFQEVIDHTTDRYGSLKPDQVLMVKDYILEDPAPPRGTSARAVGVPSPTAGYVSRVSDAGGMVEIMDREGGDVIARIRHLDPISVREGDTVTYGESLGTQSNKGLPRNAGVHAHVEMDTAHHQQLVDYFDDLNSGRLSIQPELRANTARPVVADETFRLGSRTSGSVTSNASWRAKDTVQWMGVYWITMVCTVRICRELCSISREITGYLRPETLIHQHWIWRRLCRAAS
jgi:hypothetical protein